MRDERSRTDDVQTFRRALKLHGSQLPPEQNFRGQNSVTGHGQAGWSFLSKYRAYVGGRSFDLRFHEQVGFAELAVRKIAHYSSKRHTHRKSLCEEVSLFQKST